jgi:hypothetical protein
MKPFLLVALIASAAGLEPPAPAGEAAAPTDLLVEGRFGKAVVTNEGTVPAVGVGLSIPGRLDSFTADDNYFWLDPGESRAVGVSETEGLAAGAWNVAAERWVRKP